MTDQSRRTVRTVVQALVGLAAALPVLLPTLGVPKTAAGYGVVLAVAAGVTRAMSSPVLQRFLPAWLRTEQRPADGAP
ncbi:hypothetical protein AB0K09_00405 [Streptomyces sp. NPDC049577]|uniref:hypothetical protein n=1 Tax=Streptomyces sp. NPDC049577 TaxID=3155153 RepID=UPI00343C7B50